MKKNNFSLILIRWILLAFTALVFSACSRHGSDSLVPDDRLAISTSAVVHYGKGIGVTEFYVNGRLSGHKYDGWGSSGESCCMSMPWHPTEPLMVTVRWKTYRTSFKEEHWHEATVPVHFAVPPGKSNGMKVHFLPGHRVEVWFSDEGTGSPDYPGPSYPYDPAPDYIPLSDEAPEPQERK